MHAFGGIIFKLNKAGGGFVTTKDVDYTDWASAKVVCESYWNRLKVGFTH